MSKLMNDVKRILFEGYKAAPSIAHVLKSYGWKKHRETPIYDYYSHKDYPGREIGHPVRSMVKGMWYHHAPEHKEPESSWKGRPNEFFGRGTAQLRDHLDAFHKSKNEVYDHSQTSDTVNESSELLFNKHIKLGEHHLNAAKLHKDVGLPWKEHYAASKAHYKAAACYDNNTSNANEISKQAYKLTHIANNTKLKESVQIDELSKKTIGSYIRKAHADSVTRSNHRAQDVADRRDYGYKSGNTTRYDKRIATADRKLDNREVGIRRAVKKLTREENLTNLLMKAISEGRGRPKKDGSFASEEDSADSHILMQLRKTITLRGQKPIKFHNGEVYGIHPAHAYKAMDKYSKIKTADDKEKFVHRLGHSRGEFFRAMQEEYEMISESLKPTHIVHLIKNQHGSWGSTEIGSKKVKIHIPEDDKLGVEYHASQAASKAGYKRLRNGDSVSHSVSKIEKI